MHCFSQNREFPDSGNGFKEGFSRKRESDFNEVYAGRKTANSKAGFKP
jgi:hypothetical protein